MLSFKTIWPTLEHLFYVLFKKTLFQCTCDHRSHINPRSSSAFLPCLPTSAGCVFTRAIVASRLPLKQFPAFPLFHLPPPFTSWDVNLECTPLTRHSIALWPYCTLHKEYFCVIRYQILPPLHPKRKRKCCFMWFCDLINTTMHSQESLHCRFVFTV